MSKFNIEEVKEYFDSRGYTLLSTNYINTKTPLQFICKCGRVSKTSFSNFRVSFKTLKGYRCRKCTTLLSFDKVKKCFQENNYTLLETNYVNCTAPMKFICPQGHIAKMCFSNFQRGHRCKKCSHIIAINKTKLPFEYVKKYFEDNNCTLLEKEYKNAETKMKYICSCGEHAVTIWSRFHSGGRCVSCFGKRLSKLRRNPDRELVRRNSIFSKRCNAMVRRALKYMGEKKNKKTEVILGYTRKELFKHLINHPNWDKVKNGDWSIDHIFPIKAFIEHGITDMKIINCLENLQPLDLLENKKKHDKYSEEEFLKWLAGKSVKQE